MCNDVKGRNSIFQYLLHSRQSAKCFPWLLSDVHDTTTWFLLIPPSYQGDNLDTEGHTKCPSSHTEETSRAQALTALLSATLSSSNGEEPCRVVRFHMKRCAARLSLQWSILCVNLTGSSVSGHLARHYSGCVCESVSGRH